MSERMVRVGALPLRSNGKEMFRRRVRCWPQQARYCGESVLSAVCGLAILSVCLEFLSVCNAKSVLDLEGIGHLPPDSQDNGFSQLSYGVKAVLVYRPAPCRTDSSAGTRISPWAHQLRCSVLRSASRADYLTGEVLSDTPNDFGLELEKSSIFSDHKFANSSLETEVWYQGEYVMSLEIGTPGRVFTGIIDTGSDLTWIQCRPCLACFEQSHAIFRPWDSSTYQHVSCANRLCDHIPVSFCSSPNDHCVYTYRYGDTSITFGSLSTDMFTLNSTDGSQLQLPGVVYGCAHGSEGTFTFTGTDGIIGLGQGPLSLASQIGLLLGSNKFSYCLASQSLLSDSVTSPFYFGKAAVPSNATGLSYTRIISNQRRPVLYYVEFTGMTVGNRRLKVAPEGFAIQSKTGKGGTIIDSGTTVTVLEKRAFEALVHAFASAVPYPTKVSHSGFSLCFDVLGQKHVQFPSLIFHLRGVDLDLPLENYILEVEADTLCLAIHQSRQHSFSIIGNIQQQNYHIVYDLENGQIGFKPTVCG